MLEKIPTTYSIRNFGKNPTKCIQEVAEKNEPILLLNHNKPVAVVISIREYNRLSTEYHDLDDYKRMKKILEQEKWLEDLKKGYDPTEEAE